MLVGVGSVWVISVFVLILNIIGGCGSLYFCIRCGCNLLI